VGLWSNADPEVWMGPTLVGRLGPKDDLAELARNALARLT
jgi:hypothetical protein